jgi:DNA-binding SARP family transcriptional activator
MSELNVSLLGTFKAVYQDEVLQKFRTQKVQALLIYLVVESDKEHHRKELAELLWPGLPEKSARLNLRQILHQLRRAIPSIEDDSETGSVQLLLTTSLTVRTNPEYPYELDVETFNRYLFEAHNHAHSLLLTCESCLELLNQAAELYRGPFLADFWLEDSDLFEDWALARRETYRRQVGNSRYRESPGGSLSEGGGICSPAAGDRRAERARHPAADGSIGSKRPQGRSIGPI